MVNQHNGGILAADLGPVRNFAAKDLGKLFNGEAARKGVARADQNGNFVARHGHFLEPGAGFCIGEVATYGG